MSELGHPSYLGLQAVGWKVMTGNWWERVRGLFQIVDPHLLTSLLDIGGNIAGHLMYGRHVHVISCGDQACTSVSGELVDVSCHRPRKFDADVAFIRTDEKASATNANSNFEALRQFATTNTNRERRFST
jgi:hypothetical protein